MYKSSSSFSPNDYLFKASQMDGIANMLQVSLYALIWHQKDIELSSLDAFVLDCYLIFAI